MVMNIKRSPSLALGVRAKGVMSSAVTDKWWQVSWFWLAPCDHSPGSDTCPGPLEQGKGFGSCGNVIPHSMSCLDGDGECRSICVHAFLLDLPLGRAGCVPGHRRTFSTQSVDSVNSWCPQNTPAGVLKGRCSGHSFGHWRPEVHGWPEGSMLSALNGSSAMFWECQATTPFFSSLLVPSPSPTPFSTLTHSFCLNLEAFIAHVHSLVYFILSLSQSFIHLFVSSS